MDKLLYPNLRNGLVGAWCPSIDRSRSTILTDFSGYGNHGTLTNMDPATGWVASDGKIALDFDGSTNYVNTNLLGPTGSLARSVTAWLKATSYGVVLAYGENLAARRFSCGLASTSSFGNTVGQPWIEINGSIRGGGPSVATGNWSHIAWVYSAGSQIQTSFVYVNGQRFAATQGTGTAVLNTSASFPISLGRNPTTNTDYFPDQLDDIRIYNRELTPSEIATLAQRRGIAYETYRVPIVRGAGGGGDTFTGTASLTLGGLEFSGAGTAQTPTYEATASLALGGLEFSGTASVDNPTYEATAALTLGGVEFAGAASATVNTFTATAALNLGRLDFAGSASFTAPEYTATASLSLAGIDFAGSAAFSTALRTATVEVEIGGMQFTGSATFQTPVMEASAALVLGGVEFAGADVVLGDTTIFLYYYQMMGVQE